MAAHLIHLNHSVGSNDMGTEFLVRSRLVSSEQLTSIVMLMLITYF